MPLTIFTPFCKFETGNLDYFARIDGHANACLNEVVQMVKIKFTDPAQEADGFLALSRRLNVICFPDRTYEIAKSGLSVLKELGIRYQVIAEEGFDRAYHSLRNSPASKI